MTPPILGRQYRVPSMRRIGKGTETARLYTDEETATEAFARAAKRLEAVLTQAGVLPATADHYLDVRPEAILTFLDGQDTGAALVACLAYLDWCRVNRPSTFNVALRVDWADQRGHACPVCETPLPE